MRSYENSARVAYFSAKWWRCASEMSACTKLCGATTHKPYPSCDGFEKYSLTVGHFTRRLDHVVVSSYMKDDWEEISKEAFAAWLRFHVGICAQNHETPQCAGFGVLTKVVFVFSNVTCCGPSKLNRRFVGTRHLHLHGVRISEAQ